jgi:hypothetical protein
MNFKPALWKSIISILVFLGLDFYFANSFLCIGLSEDGTSSCANLLWYSHILDIQILIISLVAGIIVYFIWSLFQRRK